MKRLLLVLALILAASPAYAVAYNINTGPLDGTSNDAVLDTILTLSAVNNTLDTLEFGFAAQEVWILPARYISADSTTVMRFTMLSTMPTARLSSTGGSYPPDNHYNDVRLNGLRYVPPTDIYLYARDVFKAPDTGRPLWRGVITKSIGVANKINVRAVRRVPTGW